jgi:hypothetical protein
VCSIKQPLTTLTRPLPSPHPLEQVPWGLPGVHSRSARYRAYVRLVDHGRPSYPGLARDHFRVDGLVRGYADGHLDGPCLVPAGAVSGPRGASVHERRASHEPVMHDRCLGGDA